MAERLNPPPLWRVGRKVKLNVYEGGPVGGRPICQCHTEEDARRIVTAVNAQIKAQESE